MHWFWRAAIAAGIGGLCLATIYLLNGPLAEIPYRDSRYICDFVLGAELLALAVAAFRVLGCPAKTAFRWLALISTPLFAAAFVLVAIRGSAVPVSAGCCNCVQLDDHGLWFYNKGERYTGSIMFASSEGRPPPPPRPGELVLSHALSWPVYFRYFDIVSGTSLKGSWWTLALFWRDLWIVLGVPPVLWLLAWPRRLLNRDARCRKCGYILRGIREPRCPECGERI